MSDLRFLGTDPAREAAYKLALARLEAERRERDAQFWLAAWADAKAGPLPMASFLVRRWRRITHKWHPSALLLSALEAVRQGAELWMQGLCENDPAATRCVRLRLLRWLTGERETEGAAQECDADLQALSPTSCAGELAEGQANQRQLPNPLAQHPARSPRSLRDLEDQLLSPAHRAKEVGSTPTQSPASSAPIGPVSSSSPVNSIPADPAPINDESATTPTRAHRLSETSE